jgi:hypothetical protein
MGSPPPLLCPLFTLEPRRSHVALQHPPPAEPMGDRGVLRARTSLECLVRAFAGHQQAQWTTHPPALRRPRRPHGQPHRNTWNYGHLNPHHQCILISLDFYQYSSLTLRLFPTADFLILITDSELKGHFVGHEIYRATQYKVLPIAPHLSTTHLLNHPIEKRLLALVHSHLYSAIFHYSYTYDLTRRMQAQWAARGEDAKKAPWEAADTRFFWNYHVSTRLIHSGLDVRTLSRVCAFSPAH